MRHLIIAFGLLIAGSSIAYACTTNTIIGPGGRITNCQTCCTGSSCVTSCW